MHMHEDLNPRSRHEPEDFHLRTQEHRFCRPSDGVSVIRTECPSILSLATNSLISLLSKIVECLPLAAECPLDYRGA
jgi:hypothetical protein